MPRCPECGGKMIYNRSSKTYICTSCGLVLTREQLDEMRESLLREYEEESRSKAKEYLEWWLGREEHGA